MIELGVIFGVLIGALTYTRMSQDRTVAEVAQHFGIDQRAGMGFKLKGATEGHEYLVNYQKGIHSIEVKLSGDLPYNLHLGVREFRTPKAPAMQGSRSVSLFYQAGLQ